MANLATSFAAKMACFGLFCAQNRPILVNFGRFFVNFGTWGTCKLAKLLLSHLLHGFWGTWSTGNWLRGHTGAAGLKMGKSAKNGERSANVRTTVPHENASLW